MRVLAGIIALAAGLAAILPGRAAEPTQSELLKAVEQQLKAVAETAGPGIACVVVSRSELYPKPAKPEPPGRLGGFDPQEFLKANPGRGDLAAHLDLSRRENIADHGYAGGVVVDPSGLVLVNYHSLEGATKIYVHLPGGTGSYADIHAADSRSDLAVLKLLTPPEKLQSVKIGEARWNDTAEGKKTVFTGKLVVMLANPYVTGFAPGRPSAALGSVTNIRRRPPDPKDEIRYKSVYLYGVLLEHDVRMSLGCSGAALLNLDGELIGLTTTVAAVATGDGWPGYALPIDANTRRIVEVLKRGEEVEYGFLGVSLPRNRSAVVVETVTPQSPAQAAGLRPGDVIVRIDDNPAGEYDDLLLYLGSALAGSKVRLEYRRGGQFHQAEVTLAKFKNDYPYIASVRPEPAFGLRVDYGSILAQSLRGTPRVESEGIEPGVAVRELVPDSPAAAKFKALGDSNRWLITRVNGIPTPTPADFYKAAKGQASVKLTVVDPTEGKRREREVTLP